MYGVLKKIVVQETGAYDNQRSMTIAARDLRSKSCVHPWAVTLLHSSTTHVARCQTACCALHWLQDDVSWWHASAVTFSIYHKQSYFNNKFFAYTFACSMCGVCTCAFLFALSRAGAMHSIFSFLAHFSKSASVIQRPWFVQKKNNKNTS